MDHCKLKMSLHILSGISTNIPTDMLI